MARLKLISLNIEMNRHLDKVKKLLENKDPDVVCLQEVLESDLPGIAKTLDYDFAYTPMSHSLQVPGEIIGVAILSKGSLKDITKDYYVGSSDELPYEKMDDNHNRCFLHGRYEKDGINFHIGTTHFPKSPTGDPDDRQREIFKAFRPILERQNDIMFAGDFNAPRGMEIFENIREMFKDNIPAHYKTSLDPNLHRAGYLPFVVDGLFTTPEYIATDVELIGGVSDHMAIFANIEKNS